MTRYKRTIFFVVMLLGVCLALEVIFYVGGKFLQSKWAMWRVPSVPTKRQENVSYDEYLQRRDPVLGWPYSSQFGKALDINGAQRNPYYPEGAKGKSCISLYGDSFTEGGDTSSLAHNWGNVLSQRVAGYVANYGTGGYGTDQAFLRFRQNADDPSPVVIFGFHTEDVIRNLTRVRDLENYERWYALKPRFVLENGKLKLIPIPDLTEDEYLRVLTAQEPSLTLPYENLQPGGPGGVVKLEFPFTISVIKNCVYFYGFRSRLFRYPAYMEFLQPEHPLQGLDITVAITREFVELAAERGKRPLVVILPHLADLNYHATSGVWPYQSVVESYNRLSIPFIDFGPYLESVSQRQDRAIQEYFGPTSHYDDEGNALVAEFVFAHLREQQVISPLPQD